MSKFLGKVSGEGFESTVWLEQDFAEQDNPALPPIPIDRVWFLGDADIDSDGGSNPDGDKYWQADTSLHYPRKPGGKAIDAETVPAIVVPGWLVGRVKGVVLGCQAKATNLRNMQWSEGVVHDTGPQTKTGEITPEMARRLGINPSSVSGGEDSPCVVYEIWPDVPATVDGITYELQPS